MLLAVLASKVSLLWVTLATLFGSEYSRELRIISLGHVKYAAKNLPQLKKYPLIYPCLKVQICPFSESSTVFVLAISESQRFWAACCRCWTFGNDCFFFRFIKSGEFKVCARNIFCRTLMVAMGWRRAANTAFSIFFCSQMHFFGMDVFLFVWTFSRHRKKISNWIYTVAKGEKGEFFYNKYI